MSEFEIKCTNCGKPMALSQALAGPILDAERRKAEAEAERRFAAERQVTEREATKVRAEDAETIAALQRAAETKDGELAKACLWRAVKFNNAVAVHVIRGRAVNHHVVLILEKTREHFADDVGHAHRENSQGTATTLHIGAKS
jgi:hypothetical protein